MFSSKSLLFLAFIHIELMFTYDVMYQPNFIPLHVDIQTSQHHLRKVSFSPHWIALATTNFNTTFLLNSFSPFSTFGFGPKVLESTLFLSLKYGTWVWGNKLLSSLPGLKTLATDLQWLFLFNFFSSTHRNNHNPARVSPLSYSWLIPSPRHS